MDISDDERIALVPNHQVSELAAEIHEHDQFDDSPIAVHLQPISTKQTIEYLLVASIGSALEYFDYSTFSSLAKQIGHNFFPLEKSDTWKLMASFSLFGISFLCRPFGALLFGYIGDKYGRVISLRWSILLMAFPTLLIGILPTYHTIGYTSTFILILLRVLQGLSVGGEVTSALVYITEMCAYKHRNKYAALVQMSCLSSVLSSLVWHIILQILTADQIMDYGWRIPFFLSFFVVVFAMYIRRFLPESTAFIEAQLNDNNNKQENGDDGDDLHELHPIKELLLTQKLRVLIIFLHYCVSSFLYYMMTVWMPVYLMDIRQNPVGSAFLLNAVSNVIASPFRLLSAHLGDLYSPIKVLLLFGTFYQLIQIFIFPSLFDSNETETWIIICCLTMLFGMSIGTVDNWVLDRLNRTQIRNSTFGFSYNLCAAIVCGLTPLLCTTLTFDKQDPYSMVYIAAVSVAFGVVSLTTDAVVSFC